MIRQRTLADVRAAGDLPWFAPALELLRGASSDPRLREFFSRDGRVYVARAPARLDVMGGIADYSGGRVLELPLARATAALVRSQDAPRLDVMSRREGRWHAFTMDIAQLTKRGSLATHATLGSWFRDRVPEGVRWASYVAGMMQWCMQRGDAKVTGLRVLIDSDIPEGRGIASSAALEVACGAAVAAALGASVSGEELAAASQAVENHVVGAPCGIMDQLTSACGKRDRLIELRCQPGSVEGYLEVPAGFRFYGIDSGISHAVTGADYGTVRTAAFMGYRMIADAAGFASMRDGPREVVDDPRWHGYLANVAAAEFEEYGDRLPDEISGATYLERYAGITDSATAVDPERLYPVRSAAAHPVGEQQRVEWFAELVGALATRPSAAIELGELMYESHRSYGACGLGSDGTDRLVQLVQVEGPERGLFGAKITGGGSGGTVAVLGTSDAEEAVQAVAARYEAETGRRATVFSDSAPGADVTGVLVLNPGDL